MTITWAERSAELENEIKLIKWRIRFYRVGTITCFIFAGVMIVTVMGILGWRVFFQ